MTYQQSIERIKGIADFASDSHGDIAQRARLATMRLRKAEELGDSDRCDIHRRGAANQLLSAARLMKQQAVRLEYLATEFTHMAEDYQS